MHRAVRIFTGFCIALTAGCQSLGISPSPAEADAAILPVAHSEPIAAAPEWHIDLDAALRFAGVDNPTILLAREQIQEALARQLAARSLLLPSVNVGGNYRLHSGAYESSSGIIRNVNVESLYLGAGGGAIGASNVAIPGVWLFADLADAVCEPRIARQQVAVRRADARAVNNAILLDVSLAYLELAASEERLRILDRGETDVNEIVRLTAAFAATGQGAPADANRASASAELVRSQRREAEGENASASARLSRLLSLDPSIRLHTRGNTVELLRLIEENADLESLLASAVRARPELLARSEAIQESRVRVRQERIRPWLPLVSVGYSSGVFGGGSNQVADEFGPLKGRSDFDVVAVWSFENLGFGNHSRVRRANAVLGESAAEYELEVNRVRREVAEAFAASNTAAIQVNLAKASVTVAEEGYRLEMDRIRQGQGRPIEALDSFRQLLDSRQELLRATLAFDAAQFRLFVAIGNSPVRDH